MKLRHAIGMKAGQLLMQAGWSVINRYNKHDPSFDYHKAAAHDARIIYYGVGQKHPVLEYDQLLLDNPISVREYSVSKISFLSYLYVPIFSKGYKDV